MNILITGGTGYIGSYIAEEMAGHLSSHSVQPVQAPALFASSVW